MRTELKLLLMLAWGASAVWAQNNPVEEGQTITISQEWNPTASTLGVGTVSADNTLKIQEDGSVHAGSALIGGTALGRNNLVLVDSGGVLDIVNSITLGDQGTNNVMAIVNGSVSSESGIIGNDASGEYNQVLLSGTNGQWNIETDLTVGNIGNNNSVLIAEESALTTENLVVGQGSAATENSVTVSGEGSLVASDVTVGAFGAENMIVLTNGGSAITLNTTIGKELNASDNSVVVTGTNSTWVNTGTLKIGRAGASGNSLVVTNGGMFYLGDELQISGANNYLNLDAGGQFFIDNDFDASMAGFNFNEGGTLGVGGALTGMTNVLEEGRGLILSGEDAVWDLSGLALTVGGNSASNTFTLKGDASAVADAFVLGGGTNSFDNLVSVTNGAALSIAGDLTVGTTNNMDNRFTIDKGGFVGVGNAVRITGTNNTLELNSGGWLSVSNDFNADQVGFVFGGDATLEVAGTLDGLEAGLDEQRTVILSGTSADWTSSASQFIIGSNSYNNTLIIRGGAQVSSSSATIGHLVSANGNLVEMSGSGSAWDSTTELTVGHAGSNNQLKLSDQASASATGPMVVGFSGNNNLVALGSNTQLTVSDTLTVGKSGSGNRVKISNGAVLQSTGASIGDEAGALGNAVYIDGAGSEWNNSGQDLYVGRLGSQSLLALSDQARLSGVGDLMVQNGSTLRFGSNSTATVSDYAQSGDSVLEFDSMIAPGDASTALITASGSVAFERGAALNYTGELALLNVGTLYTNLLVSANTLIAAGVTNATSAALSNLTSDAAGSLVNVEFTTSSNDLYIQMLRSSLGNSAGFIPGSEMALISDEIDGLASAGNAAAENQLEVANTLNGAQLNAQMTQLYDQGAPTYMHVQGMLQGVANVRRRGLLPEPLWSRPKGAEGPHRYGRELYGRQSQMWIKGYGSFASRDADSGYSPFDQTVYGTILGVDKAWGDWLAGIAGGYGVSKIDQDNGDTSDASTGYGVLYAAYGTMEWFSDANISYGHSSIDTRSGTAFGSSADFGANQIGYYIGGGKEMAVGNEFVLLTPSIALQGSFYFQDAYTEGGNNAVPMKVDSFDYISMQSVLGIKAGSLHQYLKFALMPEVRLNWIHEFNDEVDDVKYSLVGGTGNYSFGTESPVADMLEAGLSLSSRHELEDDEIAELSLSLDGRMGDGYSALGVSFRALYEF
ncbi:autotransporter domain-containing protein [Pontiellaceae bacterium B12219]|nr:autotransporter domain-containing protein [Pontiellaceae bacterium B12219]